MHDDTLEHRAAQKTQLWNHPHHSVPLTVSWAGPTNGCFRDGVKVTLQEKR